MDWLTFTVEVLKAITWPIVVVFSVLYFRVPLLSLIPGLEKLKLLGVEVQMKKDVEKAISMTPPFEIRKAGPLAENKLIALAQLSPRSAILEAWLKIETAGSAMIRDKETLARTLRSPMSLPEALRSKGLIDSDQTARMRTLRKIRNDAVHLADFPLDYDIAENYIRSASALEMELIVLANRIEAASEN